MAGSPLERTGTLKNLETKQCVAIHRLSKTDLISSITSLSLIAKFKSNLPVEC